MIDTQNTAGLKVLNTFTNNSSAKNIIALILKSRGISAPDQATFLAPPHPQNTSLFDLGIKKSQFSRLLKRLILARKAHEPVVVYGDYDADGILSTFIMADTLEKLGFNVNVFLPDRLTNGYGFSQSGIDQVLSKFNPSLIIAVDHGISGGEFVLALKKKGIDSIIIDHHIKNSLKKTGAVAQIHTTKLSASALTYFVCKEIVNASKLKTKLAKYFAADYLVFAGIGLITDIIPLSGISRAVSFHALNSFSQIENLGFIKLLSKLKLNLSAKIKSFDIGFLIGPRLNVAGRMEKAQLAYDLFKSKTTEGAELAFSFLEKLNKLRKDKLKTQLKSALEIIAKNHTPKTPFIFVCSPEFDEGVLGLIAARLVNQFNKPVFVATLNQDTIKGSARSTNFVNITDKLSRLGTTLTSFGGHQKAAGFSLVADKLNEFQQKLKDVFNSSTDPDQKSPPDLIDAEISLANVTLPLAKLVEQLEPFGEGNPQLVFLTRNVIVSSSREVGALGKHMQLVLTDTSGKEFKAIMFNAKPHIETVNLKQPVDIIYTLDINRWRNEQVNLNIKKILQT